MTFVQLVTTYKITIFIFFYWIKTIEKEKENKNTTKIFEIELSQNGYINIIYCLIDY